MSIFPKNDVALNQWIEFEDSNGRGFAQPDAFVFLPDRTVLLCEAKLTQTSEADIQLENLYSPLLWKLFALPVRKLQICKNLIHDPGSCRISSFEEISSLPLGPCFLLHWNGRGKLP